MHTKVKEKSTARSLTVSLIGIFVCVAMLFGATYAWFTNSVTTADNTVRTADFNVTLQHSDAYDGTYSALETSSVLFNGVALKPGDDTGVKYIKITNSNSYAVKASVAIGTVTTTGGTNEMELYAATGVTAAQAIGDLTKQGTTLAATTILNEATIAANGSIVVALAIKLNDDATQPGVTNTFTITVSTTQINTNS